MERSTEVLVVGAGPVGLFLSLLLAERRIKTYVIDKEQRTSTHSYALALHPETLRLLHNVDLAGELIAEGYRIDRVSFYEGAEQKASLAIGKLNTRFPYVLVLPQSRLEEALEERLRSAGVKVNWDHELSDIAHMPDGTLRSQVNRYADVPQGYPILDTQHLVTGTYEVHSPFVIGADGYHSRVRRILGTEYKSFGPPRFFSVYEFLTPTDMNHELRVVAGADRVSVLWPMPGGRCRWTFEIGSVDEHDASLARFAEFLSERAPWFTERPQQISWSACVRFERRLAERFGDNGVWLAGDAAHLTMPFSAQSMNMGMRDAHELAWRLFEVLRNNGSRDLLPSYAEQSQAEWPLFTEVSGRVQALPSASPWVRDRMANIAYCAPGTGEDLESMLLQLGLQVI